MPILSDELTRYFDDLRPERDPLMDEMEQFAFSDGVPIVRWETGRFLAVLAGSLPSGARVLEVGTAIGYSTLHMARALPENGTILTLERDPVRIEQSRAYLQRDPAGERVQVVEGDALETIAGLEGPFDLIFLDATKGEYTDYLRLVEPKAAGGALLVIDNVLMSGAVAFEDGARVPDDFGKFWGDEQRRVVRALNADLIGSDDWLSVVLPVGDGVLMGTRTQGAR